MDKARVILDVLFTAPLTIFLICKFAKMLIQEQDDRAKLEKWSERKTTFRKVYLCSILALFFAAIFILVGKGMLNS